MPQPTRGITLRTISGPAAADRDIPADQRVTIGRSVSCDVCLLDGTVSRIPRGLQRFVDRDFSDFAKLPFVKYVVVHRDLVPRVGPSGQQQAADITALARRQGRLVTQDDAVDVYQLDTFRPETVWSPRTRRLPVGPPPL